MKLANYIKDGRPRVGIVENGEVFDVVKEAATLPMARLQEVTSIDQVLSESILDLLRGVESKIIESKFGIPVDSAKLLSPVLNPEKILLVARNYLSHNLEQNARPPSEPYFFTKFRNALVAPGDAILVPRISSKVDWEGELAVIIGKAGKNISRKEAMEHVAGYAAANDVSFRDLQFSTRADNAAVALGSNWVKGKGLDSSFPLGPWLVTKDEIPDPHNLRISLSVNGKVKQDSNTQDMMFKIDSLIEYVSAGMTLKPGDVISTGTPEGVAVFTGEPFLKDGDVVEVTVSGIGTLRNPVKSES